MNVQSANVLADSTGMTGQAIIKAILTGERDPKELAAYRDHRLKATEVEIAAHLEGNWQEDLLFVPKREQDGYEFCQRQISGCYHKIEQYLAQMDDRSQGTDPPVETRERDSGRQSKAILCASSCGSNYFA